MNLKIEISPQANRMLRQLASYGLYGVTKEEVAARFVDRALIELLGNPHLKLKLGKSKVRGGLSMKNNSESTVAIDFSCNVCGVQCDLAPDPPARAVCPEHCEEGHRVWAQLGDDTPRCERVHGRNQESGSEGLREVCA